MSPPPGRAGIFASSFRRRNPPMTGVALLLEQPHSLFTAAGACASAADETGRARRAGACSGSSASLRSKKSKAGAHGAAKTCAPAEAARATLGRRRHLGTVRASTSDSKTPDAAFSMRSDNVHVCRLSLHAGKRVLRPSWSINTNEWRMPLRKFALSLAVAGVLGAATTFTGAAQAAPIGLSTQLGTAAADLNIVEKAQFFYGGRNYCFYLDGWHGPGWYWCGYAFRRGYGWGGPEGWHGWHRGEYRRHERREERYERRDYRHDRREDRRRD